MNKPGYDIVGDIHGHAGPLHRLLHKLGYVEADGIFRHSERNMIFVGDFIDRGPQQREVLRIARSMCEAGSASAVLGNHEFNAIGWAAQNEEGSSSESVPQKTRTNTQNSCVNSKRIHLSMTTPFVGLEAYPYGLSSPAFV